MLHSNQNDLEEEGAQSRFLPSSAQDCPVLCAEHRSWTAPCGVLGRGLQVEDIPSLQPGGRPASGKLRSCLQSGGQGVQASLVPRSGFWTTENQVLELTEKHKPAVDPQLASLQVSDPANMPDILFHMFYLSQVLQHRTALAVTVPCGFPVIFCREPLSFFCGRFQLCFKRAPKCCAVETSFPWGPLGAVTGGCMANLAFIWALFCCLATGFHSFHLGEVPTVINNSLAGGTW